MNRRKLLTAAAALPCAGLAGTAAAEPKGEPDLRQLIMDLDQITPAFQKVVTDLAHGLAKIERCRKAT